ncbi:MAG: phospholipid carrier-dependent glycosyltransferase [Candidatus Aenigmatarchaeota archaeon]
MKCYKKIKEVITKRYKLFCMFFLFIFFLLLVLTSFNISAVIDEGTYVGLGYRYVLTLNFTENSEHPPLGKLLFGTAQLIYKNFFDRNYVWHEHMPQKLSPSRLVVMLFSLLLAFFVFVWSKKLYGIKGGILSLLFFIFTPEIIAHSSLATLDLISAAFIFISVYFFVRMLEEPNKFKNAILTGLFFGFAISTKFSSLLLFLIFPIIFLIFIFFNKDIIRFDLLKAYFFRFLTVFFISLTLFYSFYGFKDLEITKIKGMYVILPKAAKEGLEFTKLHSSLGHSRVFGAKIYFFGKRYEDSLWYYYIIAFLIKMPIPILIASFLLFFCPGNIRKEIYVLIPLVTYFIYFSFFVNINIGIRYILPCFPFLFVLIGRLANFKDSKIIFLIFFLLVWLSIEVIVSFPNYLSYFNEFVGGSRNGYLFLSDSNLDWGQDIYKLGELSKKVDLICGNLFGGLTPNLNCVYIDCLDLDKITNYRDKYFAISVYYFTVDERCEFLRNYKPDILVGNSIFVYNISRIMIV